MKNKKHKCMSNVSICVCFPSVCITCVFVCVYDTEQFFERAVSYQQFSENPSIIDDPNLVVKIGNKYVLPYSTFSFLAAMSD